MRLEPDQQRLAQDAQADQREQAENGDLEQAPQPVAETEAEAPEQVADGPEQNAGEAQPVEFDAVEESAWMAFRDQVDAAEAVELALIRKKLKLTQREAAQLAGGGKNAFSRYERGQARPVAAVVNLFRLLDRHPELLCELR